MTGGNKRLQLLVWLRTHDPPAAHHERRNSGNAQLTRPLPVRIDSGTKVAIFKNLPCPGAGQADPLGDGYQVVDLGKIHVVDEVGLKERLVDLLAVRLGLRPLSELLGKAAVVRHGPYAIGKRLVSH